eukprot:TRINITY_DN13694_c0_g2_i1.p1 TRINITY_DN13694_c0_g2~~TRINITY_DN13694_c0_g2_i1.p1  ORF type:complete len:452 (-),score=91.21 TRINITY_DN13694_c0_g2_i1:1672-3027(-)
MGKNEFLTPKAIANRIKAKGLQKLRWYCQMCQKQCRDENGFKCHCMSESHQRQMEVFGHNPERFVDGYSEEFEEQFLEHVKRTHRFSRVAATVVYNEYINDRHHVHMNSTKWTTLTDFIKHLGRTGQCKIDETPKGWFMTYIDREPETLLKESLQRKRERADVNDEARHERALEEQIERAAKLARPLEPVDETKQELRRDDERGEKISFSLPLGSSKAASITEAGSTKGAPGQGVQNGAVAKVGAKLGISSLPLSIFEDDDTDGNTRQSSEKHSLSQHQRNGSSNGNILLASGAALPSNPNQKPEDGDTGSRKGTLEAMMMEQERAKEKTSRKDYWLCEGIVVKVVSKALKEKGYYKMKGVVQKVVDKYVGELKMVDSGHVLRVDQTELETVLPSLGGLVRIVNGAYRGSNGRLLGIDTEQFSAKVRVEKGMFDGRILQAVAYEDICKVEG